MINHSFCKRGVFIFVFLFWGIGLVHAGMDAGVEGTEEYISGSAVYDPELANHTSFGLQVMAVWFDEEASRRGIYGLKLDDLGNPLHDEFLIKEMSYSHPVRPVIAHDGTNFMVVWEDGEKGEEQTQIKGILIAKDGQKMGSEILINDAHSRKSQVSISFDASVYFIAWSDNRNARFDMTQVRGNSIYGQMLAMDGTLVRNELSLATEMYHQLIPSSTFNGYSFLLIWQRTPVKGCGSSIMGRIVFRSGDTPSPAFPISETKSCQYTLDQPAVMPDEDRFFVVWGKFRGMEDMRVYGQVVGTMGGLIGEQVSMSKPSLHSLIPYLDFDEEITKNSFFHF